MARGRETTGSEMTPPRWVETPEAALDSTPSFLEAVTSYPSVLMSTFVPPMVTVLRPGST
jgi:hypothetical protein